MHRDTETHRQEIQVMTEAEVAGTWPPAKGCLEPPGTRRGRKERPQSLQKEHSPAHLDPRALPVSQMSGLRTERG